MDLTSLSSRIALSTALPDRLAVARDLWPRGTLHFANGQLPSMPAAVASPESEEQLHLLMAWAAEHGVPLIPYGAGSGVCGAAAGRPDAITVDLKRFRNIGPIDMEKQTVRVQAGVIGQHLEDWLEQRGWATRHSPSSIWCSTVGGWAASRSAGQFSSKYGKFEDMVAAMRVVSPSGSFGTGAWSEGEDLGAWVLGTEGALGIITELSVRIVPLAERRWLRGYRFADVPSAWEAMRALLQSELHPAVLRLYDPVDTRLAGKDTVHHKEGSRFWKDLRHRASELLPQQALALPLSLPRLLNRLADSVASGCVLIAGWEGTAETTAILSAHGHRIIQEKGGVDLGPEPGEHWYGARHEVSYKLAPIFIGGGFADTMEVACLWKDLPLLYARVRQAIGRHAVVMAHFSHAYREGCSIYFTFAGVGDVTIYDALWKDALDAADSVGATVAHHHGVGQLKQQAAGRELAGLAPLYQQIKKRLDPAGIMNPGRIFPAVPLPPVRVEAPSVDPISLVAHLSPVQPAAERDRWLADQGLALRFPAAGPLREHIAGPQAPWETRIVGCVAQLPHGRFRIKAVPRSAAGPDLRALLPASAYEQLVVPLVRLSEPRWEGSVSENTLRNMDIRASRHLADGRVEILGPAAPELGELIRRQIER